MENPMLKYQKDFRRYVTSEDVAALSTVYNKNVVNTYEHEMDNSFISTSFGLTVHNLRSNGHFLLGIAEAPWAHRGDGLAIIYENEDTFEKSWCHINQTILNWWLEQAGQS